MTRISMDESSLLLNRKEDIIIEKTITNDDAIKFIENLERSMNIRIASLLNDIKEGKMNSLSLNRDSPKISLFMYGRSEEISVTFRKDNKEAKLMIPKSIISLPK